MRSTTIAGEQHPACRMPQNPGSRRPVQRYGIPAVYVHRFIKRVLIKCSGPGVHDLSSTSPAIGIRRVGDQASAVGQTRLVHTFLDGFRSTVVVPARAWLVGYQGETTPQRHGAGCQSVAQRFGSSSRDHRGSLPKILCCHSGAPTHRAGPLPEGRRDQLLRKFLVMLPLQAFRLVQPRPLAGPIGGHLPPVQGRAPVQGRDIHAGPPVTA
jgi:hypothetical protein